jgi:hypothetical protein
MYVYFTNKKLHAQLCDVADNIYSFLSKYQCSAFRKTAYIASDGYYELREDSIYRYRLESDVSLKLKSPELFVSSVSWCKSEVSTLPTHSISVDVIVERFKISDTLTFVIERNAEATVDYFFDVKGKTIDEDQIISFLSKITNVCDN